jgi:tetratricopeptide (TPR) repeat protein
MTNRMDANNAFAQVRRAFLRLRPEIKPSRSIAGAAIRFAVVLSFSQTLTGQQHLAQKSPAHFPQVEALLQQGHLDEAKAALLEELKNTPASVDGYNLLGIIESNQQDYSNALAAFERALKLSPNSTKTHNNLGGFYLSQKKPELAEKEFRNVLRVDPGNQDGNYNLGVLLLARGASSEAIPHFERIRPVNEAAAFNLMRAYFESKRNADGLRLASSLSEQSKDHVQAHFSLGIILASEKQYKLAALEFEKAEALQPNTFEILYNFGEALFRSGDISRADIELSRALKLRPDSPETLYLLAAVHKSESRPLDALNLLIRARKIAPNNTDLILLMAQISMSQEYYEDAIPLLETGVQLAPQRADLHAALGQSYFMAGQIDKALDEFKKLIELDPSARSYGFVALAYRNLGRFDDARRYVSDGLKRDPHNNACLLNLGFIDEAQGDHAGAEAAFREILRADPDFPDALLELANLRIAHKLYPEAADLLTRYIRVGQHPATGYYKLAMVERNLHHTSEADRDLKEFQSLSKSSSTGPLPFQHLFDNLDSRSKLDSRSREQLDIADLNDQIEKHPDQPEDLYLLVEAYLKSGRSSEAEAAVEQLNKLSAGDSRTLTATGVLLARYHLFDEAIRQFQAALQADPLSDEANFDLANTYFKNRLYPQALDASSHVSEAGRKDDAYLALLGDIYAHLGETSRAADIFRDALGRNPDDDQNYLALALLDLRNNNIAAARQTLMKGQARLPDSGKLFWGMGLVSVLDGNSAQAAEQLEKAVDLLPEWPGSYSVLGVFYYQTGQLEKAREVLSRFKSSSASGTLNTDRIEQFLAQTPVTSPAINEPMSMDSREQLLQLALSLADRTL